MREKGYKIGDLIFAEITKPRSPGFWGLAHRFGDLCSKNIDALSGLSAHAVLKRLQIEADIGCDNIALNFPGVGPCSYRVPMSLAFESMEQGEFHEIFKGFCRFVAATYWKTLTEDQIAEMAESMVQE